MFVTDGRFQADSNFLVVWKENKERMNETERKKKMKKNKRKRNR